MKKFIKEPLLHFLFIGVTLFLLFGWKGGFTSLPGGKSGSQSSTIIVSQNDIDQLVDTFTRTWQRSPTEEERNNLVESFVRDEIYFREALDAGLFLDDNVIRRRMRLKMEYIFEDIAAQREPTDTELLAYMQKNPETYLTDPMISFRHIYIDTDKRGQSAESDARDVLVRLLEDEDPASLGDPFLMNTEIDRLLLQDIRNQFGEAFSNKLLELDKGRWQGPVQSGFGLHLVFITERKEPRLPELKEVCDLVKRDLMAERQKELKDAAYSKLRERYTIVTEKPKADPAPAVAEAGMKTVMQ